MSRRKISFTDIDENTSPEEVDLSSFKLKDELNDDIWNDGKMNPLVRKSLLVVARDFMNNLELEDYEIEDIIMTGSLANYNWDEKYSDIDLHIVMDFGTINDDHDIVKRYFDATRKSWNKNHEITILGYPIELYMQDVNEPHKSTGVYSVLTDEWLTKPSKSIIKNNDFNESNVREQVSAFMNEIDELSDEMHEIQTTRYLSSIQRTMMSKLHDKAEALFDRISNTRKDSMKGEGSKEMSEGNIIFKALRRNGYIEKLIDIRTMSYDDSITF